MEKRSLHRGSETDQTKFWQLHHLSLGMVQKFQVIPVSKWDKKTKNKAINKPICNSTKENSKKLPDNVLYLYTGVLKPI